MFKTVSDMNPTGLSRYADRLANVNGGELRDNLKAMAKKLMAMDSGKKPLNMVYVQDCRDFLKGC